MRVFCGLSPMQFYMMIMLYIKVHVGELPYFQFTFQLSAGSVVVVCVKQVQLYYWLTNVWSEDLRLKFRIIKMDLIVECNLRY